MSRISKYENCNFMLGRKVDPYNMAVHNRVSWDKILRVFKTRKVVSYRDLKDATAGHKHGDAAHHGRDSGSFVRYCMREGWIMITARAASCAIITTK